jgi:hypothetical protein
MALPPATNGPQPGGPSQPTTPAPNAEPAKPPLELLSEAVYVLMKSSEDDYEWMCTGALVAKDVVLTAGHCLGDPFVAWEVVAPLAKDKPRVSASYSAALGYGGDDPSAPDIGFLKLDTPIELPAYAQMTDISERVDKGEKLTGVAIVRTDEEPLAPFKSVDNLEISSTKNIGYEQGISTPFFTHGGDSGAGLFLVENGRATHKLVGIARNPEQSRKLDHFTRLGTDFKKWFDENVNGE